MKNKVSALNSLSDWLPIRQPVTEASFFFFLYESLNYLFARFLLNMAVLESNINLVFSYQNIGVNLFTQDLS